jgi:hypothetical protein
LQGFLFYEKLLNLITRFGKLSHSCPDTTCLEECWAAPGAWRPGDPPKLYFFIDHWEGERYVEFDTKTHIPEHGSRWAALQYRFTRSGAYRVARNSKPTSPLDDQSAKPSFIKFLGFGK